MKRRKKRKSGKTRVAILPASKITKIKKLLDSYRLVHGYTLTKRKRKRKK